MRLQAAGRTLGQTFGAWGFAALAGAWLGALRVAGAATLPLDRLFFPALNTTRIDRPILMVGNPRTGTTFLQRFLVDNGVGAGLQVNRMLWPSLTQQALLRPVLPLLERLSPTRYHDARIHKTGLTAVETDDAALLFRHADGFFLYGFVLAFADDELMHLVDPVARNTLDRDLAWLTQLWRRSLVATGRDRVIAKPFSFGVRVPQVLDRIPDAKVLYTARDPVQMVPSTLSLITSVLDKKFGFWTLPEPVRARYLERVYAGVVELLRRFHGDWTEGRIPTDRVFIVRFDRMMSDFEPMMDRLLDFCEVDQTPALRAAIAERAAKQRAYKSTHAYDLARFGLSAQRIRHDTRWFTDTFLGD